MTVKPQTVGPRGGPRTRVTSARYRSRLGTPACETASDIASGCSAPKPEAKLDAFDRESVSDGASPVGKRTVISAPGPALLLPAAVRGAASSIRSRRRAAANLAHDRQPGRCRRSACPANGRTAGTPCRAHRRRWPARCLRPAAPLPCRRHRRRRVRALPPAGVSQRVVHQVAHHLAEQHRLAVPDRVCLVAGASLAQVDALFERARHESRTVSVTMPPLQRLLAQRLLAVLGTRRSSAAG